ncbi:WXG100 family type VII secretion target [Streptacidiphilus sp. PAMC 29251]
MGDTDYNGNGFNQGGDGAIFGDPGSDPGSVSDYDTWDWKQIEAAISGMSAGVDDSDNQSHALAVSDPNSLNKAANAFYAVQVTLSEIAESLDAQAKALAGPDGPWKGDAADSFINMMTTFSRQVKATADVLSGGATGTHSIPQQLADNAVNLLNAKNKIVEIDNWYANQAIQMGVHPMSNGLIPISQKPQLVQMMTSDMRGVLKSLAGEYQVTIDSVRSPQPITSPGDNTPDTIPEPNPDDLSDTDGITDPGLQPADLSDLQAGQDPALAPFPGDLSTGDSSGLPFGGSDPALMDAALNPAGGIGEPSPFPGGTDTGGPSALADPSAFPGGTDTGGPGGLADPSAFPRRHRRGYRPGRTAAGQFHPDALPTQHVHQGGRSGRHG